MRTIIFVALLTSCYLFRCFAIEENDDYETKIKKIQDHGDSLCRSANMNEYQCNEFKQKLSQLPTNKEDAQKYLKTAKLATGIPINLPPGQEL